MDKEELIIYAIRTSEAIKEEKKQELIDYVSNLQQENQKYKEVIDKAIEYINKMFNTGFYNDDYYLGHLNQILQDKEVE